MDNLDDATVSLERFVWEEDDTDIDANFKREVALYTLDDPLPTVRRLSRNLDIPVGSVVRYVLCKWAASGGDALLEMGPDVVTRMSNVFQDAETADTAEARLEAYETARQIISWMRVPLDDPGYRNVR